MCLFMLLTYYCDEEKKVKCAIVTVVLFSKFSQTFKSLT
jgi:hypothetical protein